MKRQYYFLLKIRLSEHQSWTGSSDEDNIRYLSLPGIEYASFYLA
jgi:hypothetical protein